MEHHPIETIMTTTMENIKDMVDVNTVIGDPVQTLDGSTVIPISRVSFGFVAGGGEYRTDNGNNNALPDASAPQKNAPQNMEQKPFAGGTGAGVTVQPMGFLVINENQVKMLPAQYYAPVDRIIELVPEVISDLKKWMGKDKSTATMPDSQAPQG